MTNYSPNTNSVHYRSELHPITQWIFPVTFFHSSLCLFYLWSWYWMYFSRIHWDEIGSTSERMINVNIIATNNHETGFLLHDIQLTFHISSVVGIKAAVTMFQSCSIITSESKHPDRSNSSYYDKAHDYSTSAAFIDRNISEPYFSGVVFS